MNEKSICFVNQIAKQDYDASEVIVIKVTTKGEARKNE
jgi:hypothetical protein